MAGYRDLVVWQKAMNLVEEIYRIISLLPKQETYALSDQLRRAAISIPSNIAEGHARESAKDFSRFLYISQGSRAELETQLEICVRLQYLTEGQIQYALALCADLGKMICNLIRTLN